MIQAVDGSSSPAATASHERASSRDSASSAGASSSSGRSTEYDTASSSRHSSSTIASSSATLPLPMADQPSFEAMIASATSSSSSSSSSSAESSSTSSVDSMSQQSSPSLPSTTAPSSPISSPSQSFAESDPTGEEEKRPPQAGPLPSKRGEIGFMAGVHLERPRSAHIEQQMPERHPADRRSPSPTAGNDSELTSTTPRNNPTPATSTTDASSISKKKRILHFFKGSRLPSYGGLRLTTLLIFFGQICLIAGTITAWVVAVRRVKPGANQTGPQMQGTSSFIFVHVVFAIATLGQLLFLERRVFRLRAERYMYLHPGAILPTSYHGMDSNIDPAIIALSPWNRPPLPTYAAALQQSGAGTGDVEDHMIAAPPPPAYGNTRGSTLLLSGFLRQSLRAQRPLSVHSQRSVERSIAPGERPVSYASQDGQWEEICDAERARRLEQTLSRLERPSSRASHQSRESRR
ncbi:hypothetical protein HGRIS_005802 [Hohenbuehelia grisea]|uniref:Uncharacterized protein n=1 Tax=Hohenbuehelia grisea TaxID=104357 RepID=A0ABR3JY38_9AGAR